MAPQPSPAAQRAAAMVWLTACVEVGLFGACSLALHRADALTLPMLAMMAAVALVPGVLYFGLGFGVRSRQAPAVWVALLLAVMQLLVLAVMLGQAALAALSRGEPLGVTLSVVLPGSLLALVGATVWRLCQALPSPTAQHT